MRQRCLVCHRKIKKSHGKLSATNDMPRSFLIKFKCKYGAKNISEEDFADNNIKVPNMVWNF